jgi:hypothetical protein
MYNTLFYFLYSYYDKTEKWKETKVPYLSTILVIAVLQMANYLFIRDLIYFQFNGQKYSQFAYENFIIPTIFIGFNYWYFKRNGLYKQILNKFSVKKLNLISNLTCWIYIIISIALAIAVGYSVRNNIKWFE